MGIAGITGKCAAAAPDCHRVDSPGTLCSRPGMPLFYAGGPPDQRAASDMSSPSHAGRGPGSARAPVSFWRLGIRVAGHRTGDNPARWGGNLKELLPKPSKVANE